MFTITNNSYRDMGNVILELERMSEKQKEYLLLAETQSKHIKLSVSIKRNIDVEYTLKEVLVNSLLRDMFKTKYTHYLPDEEAFFTLKRNNLIKYMEGRIDIEYTIELLGGGKTQVEKFYRYFKLFEDKYQDKDDWSWFDMRNLFCQSGVYKFEEITRNEVLYSNFADIIPKQSIDKNKNVEVKVKAHSVWLKTDINDQFKWLILDLIK